MLLRYEKPRSRATINPLCKGWHAGDIDAPHIGCFTCRRSVPNIMRSTCQPFSKVRNHLRLAAPIAAASDNSGLNFPNAILSGIFQKDDTSGRIRTCSTCMRFHRSDIVVLLVPSTSLTRSEVVYPVCLSMKTGGGWSPTGIMRLLPIPGRSA